MMKRKLRRLTDRRVNTDRRKNHKFWDRKIRDHVISEAKKGNDFFRTVSIDKHDNAALAIKRYAAKHPELAFDESPGENDLESIFTISWKA